MPEDRSKYTGMRGIDSPRDKDRSADPHRKTCRYSSGDKSWASMVDWAVYHAPGWEQWQDFRVALKGLSAAEKAAKLRGWLRSHPGEVNVYRVLNYARSQRSTWPTTPAMKAINDDLGPKIKGDK